MPMKFFSTCVCRSGYEVKHQATEGKTTTRDIPGCTVPQRLLIDERKARIESFDPHLAERPSQHDWIQQTAFRRDPKETMAMPPAPQLSKDSRHVFQDTKAEEANPVRHLDRELTRDKGHDSRAISTHKRMKRDFLPPLLEACWRQICSKVTYGRQGDATLVHTKNNHSRLPLVLREHLF